MPTTTWEVRAGRGRYVRWVEGRREADPKTDLALDVALFDGARLPLTPTGPYYRVSGPDDATATYLAALDVLGVVAVTGTPPSILPVSPPILGEDAVGQVDGPGVPRENPPAAATTPVRPGVVASLLAAALLHAGCDEYCLAGTAPGESKIHPGPCRDGGRGGGIPGTTAGKPTAAERSAQVSAMPPDERRALLARHRPDLVEDGSIESVSDGLAARMIVSAERRDGSIAPDVDPAEQERQERIRATVQNNLEALEDYRALPGPVMSGGRTDLPEDVSLVPVADLRSNIKYTIDGFDFSRDSEWDRLVNRQLESPGTADFVEGIAADGMQPIQLTAAGDEILNGHHRLAMALLMGLQAIPVSTRDYENWGDNPESRAGNGRDMFAVQLRPADPSLTAAASPHAWCTDLYCLNGTAPGERPVHPGPCRGWKEALRKVAPGALKIIEDERKRKLAERRKTGKAGKPDKAGGGKPDTPTTVPDVEISQDTRDAIAAAVAALPQDEAGWHALSGRSVRPPARRIDTRLEELRAKLPAAQEAFDRALIAAREQVRKERYSAQARRRKRMSPEEEDRARQIATYSFDLGGRDLIDTQSSIDHWEKEGRDIEEARANGTPLTASQQHWDAVVAPDPTLDAERDPNGVVLPNAGLVEAERAVRAAGNALRGDLDRAFRADPEIRRLEDADDAALTRQLNGETPELRAQARAETRRIRAQINARRRLLTLNALGQIRPIGNERHTRVTPLGPGQVRAGTHPGSEARADWRARLETSDRHFPDDWTRISARSEIEVQASDRAFYAEGLRGWEDTPEGERHGILAMNTDNNIDTAYMGGFDDYVDEVTVHEMGHRMEQQIPGVRALEFAWVRSHTTTTRPDGTREVEAARRLADIHPNSSYESYEVARPDRFANAYAGRDYSPQGGDPAAMSWEVFQVGLQEVYGRSRSFGPPGESLRDFTLGVLATVGRAS